MLAPAQLANLPAGRVVAFRRGMAPVIGRAEQAHRRRDVRTALTGHEPWWVRLLAPLARRLARLRPPYPAGARRPARRAGRRPVGHPGRVDGRHRRRRRATATRARRTGGRDGRPRRGRRRRSGRSPTSPAGCAALSAAGRDADPAERAAFLADKDALIARIEATNRRADTADDARPGSRRELTGEPPGDEHSATSDDDGEEWSR